MATYQMQAVSDPTSSGGNAQLYAWTSLAPDWAGAGFPGPGTPIDVAVAAVFLPGAGAGTGAALASTSFQGEVSPLGAANTVLTSTAAPGGVWQQLADAHIRSTAAIAGTKIVPVFGTQAVGTRSTIVAGALPGEPPGDVAGTVLSVCTGAAGFDRGLTAWQYGADDNPAVIGTRKHRGTGPFTPGAAGFLTAGSNVQEIDALGWTGSAWLTAASIRVSTTAPWNTTPAAAMNLSVLGPNGLEPRLRLGPDGSVSVNCFHIHETLTQAGLTLANAGDIAHDGAQEWSPALRFLGSGWTEIDSEDSNVEWVFQLRPAQVPGGDPRPDLVGLSQIESGGFETRVTFTSDGIVLPAYVALAKPPSGVKYGGRVLDAGGIPVPAVVTDDGLERVLAPFPTHRAKTTTNDAALTTALTLAVADNTVLAIRVRWLARQSGGSPNYLVVEKTIVAARVAGAAVELVPGSEVTSASKVPAGWGGASIAAAGNNALIRIQGVAATPINWEVEAWIEEKALP